MLETNYWLDFDPKKSKDLIFYTALTPMVQSLISLNCISFVKNSYFVVFTDALVILQWIKPLDYQKLKNFVRDNSTSLNISVFEYLWDIPLMEYMIHIYSKSKHNESKVQYLVVFFVTLYNFHEEIFNWKA